MCRASAKLKKYFTELSYKTLNSFIKSLVVESLFKKQSRAAPEISVLSTRSNQQVENLLSMSYPGSGVNTTLEVWRDVNDIALKSVSQPDSRLQQYGYPVPIPGQLFDQCYRLERLRNGDVRGLEQISYAWIPLQADIYDTNAENIAFHSGYYGTHNYYIRPGRSVYGRATHR